MSLQTKIILKLGCKFYDLKLQNNFLAGQEIYPQPHSIRAYTTYLITATSLSHAGNLEYRYIISKLLMLYSRENCLCYAFWLKT